MRDKLIILLCVALCACASNTPLENQQNKDRATGVVGGAVVGAAVACAGSYLDDILNKKNGGFEKCKDNAIVGAAAGAIAGFALGEVAAQRRAQYQAEVNDLNNTGEERRKALAKVQADLLKTQGTVKSQQAELVDMQAKRRKGENMSQNARAYLSKVEAQLSDGRKSEIEYAKYRDDVQAKIQTLKGASRAMTKQDQTRHAQRINDLTGEYQQLAQVVKSLNGINESLQTQSAQAQILVKQTT